MSASNYTKTLKLPIYAADDKPTILVDYNTANRSIDSFAENTIAELDVSGKKANDALNNSTEALNKANEVHDAAIHAEQDAHEALVTAGNALTIANGVKNNVDALELDIDTFKPRLVWHNSDPNISIPAFDVHIKLNDDQLNVIDRARFNIYFYADAAENIKMAQVARFDISGGQITAYKTDYDRINSTEYYFITRENMNRSVAFNIERENKELIITITDGNNIKDSIKIEKATGVYSGNDSSVTIDNFLLVPIEIVMEYIR